MLNIFLNICFIKLFGCDRHWDYSDIYFSKRNDWFCLFQNSFYIFDLFLIIKELNLLYSATLSICMWCLHLEIKKKSISIWSMHSCSEISIQDFHPLHSDVFYSYSQIWSNMFYLNEGDGHESFTFGHWKVMTMLSLL